MASNDTAALVVALSAQLTKFEKDMKGAVDIADKRSREIETRFSQLNKVASDQFSKFSANAAGNIGAIGSALLALGPVGITAAVALGAAAGGLLFLINATNEFAEKSKRLKEGAETAGLTITQFKLLGQQGKLVGLDFEETAAFFTKFIANLEALRGGSGPLYDALLKIDTGLLRQLSVTKDSAQAIDLLVAAFVRLDDQTKKLDLAKAAGGRGGLSGVRLLESLGQQGGVAGVEAKSPTIDEGQIERAARLKVEIDAIGSRVQNIWGRMFSDTILENQKSARLEIEQIALWIERIVKGTKEIAPLGGPASPLKLTVHPAQVGAPAPTPGSTAGSPAVELAILQKNMALVGEAITQGEQWKLKRLEIAAAAEKGGLMDGIAGRALAAFNLTMRASALATRERLGVASEQEIVEVKLAQLQQDRIKFGLSENEVLRATNVIMREAKLAAQALAVRQSYLPGLKQLEFDAADLWKNLDTTGVNSINNLGTALGDIVTGTAATGDAFRNLSLQVIRSITDMIIRMTILAPIAKAMQAALGGFLPGGGGAPLDINFPGRAGGGPVSAGMPYVIGENGPEVMVPQSAGMVLPNGVMPSSGSSSSITNTFHISVASDATSGDPVAAAQTGRAIRRELEGMVISLMQKQQRPRGALNPA